MCKLRCTNQNAETAVLEQRGAVIDQRWQCIANALRHDDETHRRDIAVTKRACRFHLAGIDGTHARAQILAEIGRLTETKADNGEDRFRIVAGQPVPQSAWQQREDTEIPKHELHECRNVAVIGNIGRHKRIAEPEG